MSAAASNLKDTDAPQAAEWVTLPEASRLTGKHREQVLVMVVRGELVADTRGKYTWISRDSIERYLAGKQ
jgi:hypothetical protein